MSMAIRCGDLVATRFILPYVDWVLEQKNSIIINTLYGAPGKIRTPDPQIRSLVLYPAELPALWDVGGDAPPRGGGH